MNTMGRRYSFCALKIVFISFCMFISKETKTSKQNADRFHCAAAVRMLSFDHGSTYSLYFLIPILSAQSRLFVHDKGVIAGGYL